MSHYEAKLDDSYKNSVEAWLPPQMSLLGHLANFHQRTGMLQKPATLGLSSEKAQATMHFLKHTSFLDKTPY